MQETIVVVKPSSLLGHCRSAAGCSVLQRMVDGHCHFAADYSVLQKIADGHSHFVVHCSVLQRLVVDCLYWSKVE